MTDPKSYIRQSELMHYVEVAAYGALAMSEYESELDCLYLFLACMTSDVVTEDDLCEEVYTEMGCRLDDNAIAHSKFMQQLVMSKLSYMRLSVAYFVYDYAMGLVDDSYTKN